MLLGFESEHENSPATVERAISAASSSHAKLKWLRITANMHAGGYDVYEAEGALPEPEWPAHDIDTLVEVAFRGKIIASLDHPVIQTLLGKI